MKLKKPLAKLSPKERYLGIKTTPKKKSRGRRKK